MPEGGDLLTDFIVESYCSGDKLFVQSVNFTCQRVQSPADQALLLSNGAVEWMVSIVHDGEQFAQGPFICY